MSLGSDGDCDGPRVRALYIGNNPIHALSVHAVAKATVEAVVQEAVAALAHGVVDATYRSTGAVRDEMIFQTVEIDDEPKQLLSKHSQRDETLQTEVLHPLLPRPPTSSRSSSAMIHAVSKATVDAVTDEAVRVIVEAVGKATEWISQAVSNELVSQSVNPIETVALHNATEWIIHAVDGATSSTNNCADSVEQQECFSTSAIVAGLDVPRLSCKAPTAVVHALAKELTETAVNTALHNVIQTVRVQAAPGELVTQTIIDTSSHDETHTDEADNNFTVTSELEEPQQSSPSVEKYDTPVHVPALRLPNATDNSSEAVAKYHDQAVLLINDVFSSALRLAVPVTSPEPQEYEDDGYEDYTPINSPTSEDTSSTSPRLPEQGAQFIPPVILSGRATPPDTKLTPRHISPITTKRGLGTPTPRDNAPSSAPAAIPSPRIVQEPPTDLAEPEPSQQTLPLLALPAVQVSGRMKQQLTPRRTPRQSSPVSNSNEELYSMESPRTSSSRHNKHTPRTTISAEFELTPKSSARAAAIIYTQPPSSQHHPHRHKSKKLRDSASQTSPPPSPPSTSFPCQLPLGMHENSNSSDLPKARASHSKRNLSPPENFSERKTEGSNNTLLAPLPKTSIIPSPSKTKSPTSPSRPHMSSGHSHKGHGGGPSPNKRSGYCSRCVFEGRSCKINDCLKHQLLK
ncbi:Hypothetical protein PHPALM_21063 [Phytophthora palmivora]|uniref:Uncharacterized protein n=1 Tax=Phytophthora palmivora TaxID=4796 RepID=A0A2P4XD96_9STRA|nr:Hypothetical protein PHPALM_21063 [Phytophthora palmivora]